MAVRVVVVGAGFGGLSAARSAAKAGMDVTLLDRRNFHLFQPLLYQVATAALEPADIAYPLRGILRREPRVRVRNDEVVGADLDSRCVLTAAGDRIGYDHLVLATGAETADFGVPGVAEHAFGLKSLEDALGLRSHLLRCFEEADRDPSVIDRGALTFVVVGGGPTGVEMAGSLLELFHAVLAKDFPAMEVARAQVLLVEMGPDVLPPFHPKSRHHARDTLRDRGAQLLLGRTVTKATSEEVHLDNGEVIPAWTLLWAAGVQANPLAKALGVATGRGGRIIVNPDLSVPDRPGVWSIGDVAASLDRDGQVLPQLAQVAIQGGRHVTEQVQRLRAGQPTQAFRYRDKGTMATIGRRAAVAELPPGLRFRGTLAWVMWLALHLLFLIGFRNRVSVFIDWAWNYLTWDRGARLIQERHSLPSEYQPDRDSRQRLRRA